jgi:hypothetical protein
MKEKNTICLVASMPESLVMHELAKVTHDDHLTPVPCHIVHVLVWLRTTSGHPGRV